MNYQIRKKKFRIDINHFIPYDLCWVWDGIGSAAAGIGISTIVNHKCNCSEKKKLIFDHLYSAN